jgi:hypothetical protein
MKAINMSKLKKIQGPIPVTLDNLLAKGEEYNKKKVLTEHLVINAIAPGPERFDEPCYLLVQDKNSPKDSKKIFIWAYETAHIISLFSKPGDEIDVTGIFYYKDSSRGTHIESSQIKNYSLSEVEI